MSENGTLKELSKFHGHLGPYLVIGWKMGEIAKQELSDDPFELKAKVKTGIGPPLSCIVDGIQFSTGCTLGKGNIEIIDEGLPEATITNEDKSMTLTLNKEYQEKMNEVNEKNQEKIAKEIFDTSPKSLLKIIRK